jgi:Pyridoxal-phosphate dependent enzyme/TIR domain
MRTYLSYSHIDKDQATVVAERIGREKNLDVTIEPIDFRPVTAKSFMDSVREHDAVLHLISSHFLRSRYCMRELIPLMNDNAERNFYRDRTMPLILGDSGLNLLEGTDQQQLVEFWRAQARELEIDLNAADKAGVTALDELRGDLTVVRGIAESVGRFVRLVIDSAFAAGYNEQHAEDFVGVIARLREINSAATAQFDRAHRITRRLLHPISPQPLDDAQAYSPEEELLRSICSAIQVASESDPSHPEFPPFAPRYPATPIHEVYIDAIGRPIKIKDESYNHTGSHKDRMAWEIVVYYRKVLEDRLASGQVGKLSMPAASIISNGSAALAIQVLFRCFALPPLRVLIDDKAKTAIVDKLQRAGCEIFRHDLSRELLDSSDVLELTSNKGGLDFTARSLVDPNRRTYYDWLAYEILNAGAKHIFIPVGTGDLYVNVLTVLRDELTGVTNDGRLEGGYARLVDRQVYGATSNDQKTKMDKLYATHRPTLDEARTIVAEMCERGQCGDRSRIYDVGERAVGKALEIARGHKIQTEESGIAGLGLLLEMNEKSEIPPDEELLVVNTGWLALP